MLKALFERGKQQILQRKKTQKNNQRGLNYSNKTRLRKLPTLYIIYYGSLKSLDGEFCSYFERRQNMVNVAPILPLFSELDSRYKNNGLGCFAHGDSCLSHFPFELQLYMELPVGPECSSTDNFWYFLL